MSATRSNCNTGFCHISIWVYLCMSFICMDWWGSLVAVVEQVMKPHILEAPIILFLDSHRCHMIASVITQNNELFFTDGCTSLCQPVDVRVTQSLHAALCHELYLTEWTWCMQICHFNSLFLNLLFSWHFIILPFWVPLSKVEWSLCSWFRLVGLAMAMHLF